ncbi:unnamed protein product [Rotaria sordida]|uniref:PCI domain-containing protein n=1 Tax=Rotaria sordida TaxID=392033 RepID=A0A813S3K1_9BILA|nr:unnamed protein product [Rotaria sordida]
MPGIIANDSIQQMVDEKPKLPEQIDLEEAETALAGKDYKLARELLEKLVKLEVIVDNEDSVRIKETAVLTLGRLYKETKDAKALASLIKTTRPFLGLVSKAKAAKLVRTLVDLFLDMEAGTGEEVSLCQENIEWAKSENRTFLRQDLEARLVALYYDTHRYNEALTLGSQLLKELKKLDDKQLLVEVQLFESKTYFALSNLQKARAALTSARTTANGIYTPPKLQASLDLQSGILHAAEDKDFKTAFSYFYEAFEGYDQINSNKGIVALKYMLLSKVMMNTPDDVNALMSVKLALKYSGRDVEAMKAVAQASKKRSLADFQQALKDYKTELSDDPMVHSHLGTLYDNLLEQNLCRLLEPFSNVQIEHIAHLINLPQDVVEKKLSQMILDKKFIGILDQGSSNIVIFDETPSDTQYQDALVIIQNMSKVVDTLFKALDLFDQKFEICTDFTIALAIKACTILNDYKRGINIQQKLSSNSLNNSYIQTSLIHLHIQCHVIDNVTRLFSTTTNKSNYIYTRLISNNMLEKVPDFLDHMTIEPNNFTLTILYNTYAQLTADRSMKIRRKLLDETPNNYRSTSIILNSAIHMLMKFGQNQCSERVFRFIRKKDIIPSNAMMKGYIENEMSEKALDLFEQINLNLENITYTIVSNTCTQLTPDQAMKIGKKLLDEMPDNYQNDNILLTSTTHMLIKFDDIQSAECVVKLIRNKDIITYTALMNDYNVNDEPWKCLKIFEGMKQQDIVLDEIIGNVFIDACLQIGMIRRSQYIIDQIPLHIQNQIQILLIDMWRTRSSVKNVQNVYKSVYDRDTMSYTAMINGFGFNEMNSEAIELYRQMPNNQCDEVSSVYILNTCSHSDLLHELRNIFNEIPVKTEKIVTIMIDCLSRLLLFDEALQLIDEYETINLPNFVMYICLLSGTCNNRNRNLSEKIYNRMKSLFHYKKQDLLSDAILLANIYSPVGEHQLAKNSRSNQIKELPTKVNVELSWTDVNGEAMFKVHDRCHPLPSEIYIEADLLTSELIKYSYNFDSSWMAGELHQVVTIESVLCGLEKLARACNFIQRPTFEIIQCTKNFHVYSDCYEATKLIKKFDNIILLLVILTAFIILFKSIMFLHISFSMDVGLSTEREQLLMIK